MPEIDLPELPLVTIGFMPEVITAVAVEYVSIIWRLTPETIREIIQEGIDSAGIDPGYEEITP